MERYGERVPNLGLATERACSPRTDLFKVPMKYNQMTWLNDDKSMKSGLTLNTLVGQHSMYFKLEPQFERGSLLNWKPIQRFKHRVYMFIFDISVMAK